MNPKLKTQKGLKATLETLKKENKTIVTTNGAFDILHSAHLRFLEKAKALGDCLIVLLNSDTSVKKFKGSKRPILSEIERAEHLSHLRSVDYITIFSEDNPLSLLKEIQPKIHVKGGSFIPERAEEEKTLLESWGGEFKALELEEGYSTTNAIQKILDTHSQSSHKECPGEMFNRNTLNVKPLSERESKSDLSILINPNSPPPQISESEKDLLIEIVNSMRQAKENSSPIILAFGAHLVKNGLSLILIELMKKGYIQHLLGNGAISIHDWELAFQGKTEEDVRKYIAQGQFGIWHETGYYLNETIKEGSKKGLGYGESVGRLIQEETLGSKTVPHPNKAKSLFANAYKLKIPISICPGIGYDIVHTHPSCDGAAIGESSYLDFLKFSKTLTSFEGGVYLSIGSAITSPMVFEKALSMAKNLALQENKTLENYRIYVNDIQEGTWDWTQGEPPKDNPAYYLRFMKTFARMGGTPKYIKMDNKAFLHNLYHLLK